MWTRTTADGQAALLRVVRGIAPFPAARLPLVRPGAEIERGALPPEVVTAPPATTDGGPGLWPAAAALGALGALALLCLRLLRGRRRRSTALPPPATP